jgi:hypothetical protein
MEKELTLAGETQQDASFQMVLTTQETAYLSYLSCFPKALAFNPLVAKPGTLWLRRKLRIGREHRPKDFMKDL